jgi:hypothetical protein
VGTNPLAAGPARGWTSAGDDVVIRATGSGRIEVERADDLIARFAGSLPAGTYPAGHLDELRDEWRR